MKIDKNSLAHSAWNYKYHKVFAPKYRRMEMYGKIRKDTIRYFLSFYRLYPYY